MLEQEHLKNLYQDKIGLVCNQTKTAT